MDWDGTHITARQIALLSVEHASGCDREMTTLVFVQYASKDRGRIEMRDAIGFDRAIYAHLLSELELAGMRVGLGRRETDEPSRRCACCRSFEMIFLAPGSSD